MQSELRLHSLELSHWKADVTRHFPPSEGLAVFSAGTASHSRNNKAVSGLSSAVNLNRNTQTPTQFHFMSKALCWWPWVPLDISLILRVASPALHSARHGRKVRLDQRFSRLPSHSWPSVVIPPSDACKQRHECTVTLSITILLQKLNSSSLSFAMLGAYNNTVKNPDPEKIVKQISTMLSQHSVIHAVTIQKL